MRPLPDITGTYRRPGGDRTEEPDESLPAAARDAATEVTGDLTEQVGQHHRQEGPAKSPVPGVSGALRRCDRQPVTSPSASDGSLAEKPCKRAAFGRVETRHSPRYCQSTAQSRRPIEPHGHEKTPDFRGFYIGALGFEPRTSPTRTVRATRLRHAPTHSPVSHTALLAVLSASPAPGVSGGRPHRLPATRTDPLPPLSHKERNED